MKVSCQSCSAKYTIADEKVSGRIVKIRCKKCGATIVVNGNDMAAASADPTESEVWTLSVDDNDQRTMTQAEVVAAYQSGVINDETYCWKEGMADWLPLREIGALAGAVGGGGRVSLAPAPLDEAPGGSDLFGNPVGDSLGSGGDTGLSGGGLFGDAPLAAAAPAAATAARRTGGRAGGDLFSGVAAAGGEEDVMTSAPGLTPPPSGDTKLTGQRNENSVLFSLNALTTTANEPKNETTAQGDASGLIDIRALSSSLKSEDSSSKVDDIMNLSGGGAFNAALTAPALAPPMVVGGGAGMGMGSPSYAPAEMMPQQSSNKGLMFGLIGLGAFILVAALVVVFAFKEDKDENLARNDPPAASTGVALPTTPSDPAPNPTDTAAPTTSSTAQAPNVGGATANAGEKPAAGKGGGGTAKNNGETAVTAPAPAPAPAPAKPKSLADEMAKAAGGSATQNTGGGGGGGAGTAPFDRGAASAALGGVNVSSCKKDQSGSGHVKVVFAPNGSVSSATVDQGPFVGTAVGGCVAGKYRGARVPPFSGSPVSVGKSFSIN